MFPCKRVIICYNLPDFSVLSGLYPFSLCFRPATLLYFFLLNVLGAKERAVSPTTTTFFKPLSSKIFLEIGPLTPTNKNDERIFTHSDILFFQYSSCCCLQKSSWATSVPKQNKGIFFSAIFLHFF